MVDIRLTGINDKLLDTARETMTQFSEPFEKIPWDQFYHEKRASLGCQSYWKNYILSRLGLKLNLKGISEIKDIMYDDDAHLELGFYMIRMLIFTNYSSFILIFIFFHTT